MNVERNGRPKIEVDRSTLAVQVEANIVQLMCEPFRELLRPPWLVGG